jgi:hypothetical protein
VERSASALAWTTSVFARVWGLIGWTLDWMPQDLDRESYFRVVRGGLGGFGFESRDRRCRWIGWSSGEWGKGGYMCGVLVKIYLATWGEIGVFGGDIVADAWMPTICLGDRGRCSRMGWDGTSCLGLKKCCGQRSGKWDSGQLILIFRDGSLSQVAPNLESILFHGLLMMEKLIRFSELFGAI